MSKIELHYTPEQLGEINKLMRERLIKEIKGMGFIKDLPSSQVENEIRVVITLMILIPFLVEENLLG